MKIKVENEKENLVKIDIVVPAKDAQAAYDGAVRRISQYINVAGFRKGKAPRQVVERQVGVERIQQEAVENLAPRVINQAVEKHGLDLITQPYITSFEFKSGEDLKMTAKAEVRPEVTLGKYKDLTVNVNETPIPEGAFDTAINNLLKNSAALEPVKGRAAKNTDTTVIDFDGYVNGEKIKGGEGKDYPLDLANSNFIPGFAEQIPGHKAGEEFEINVTFPENYHDDALKGQPAVFKIKLKEVKEKKLPELTDEFAQKVGPFKTVQDLKNDINKFLEGQRDTTNRQNSETAVFRAVVDAAKVDIPESMVAREVASLKAEYENRLKQQGVTWEMVTKTQREEEIMKTMRADALIRIKNSLVIDKIAKVENINLEKEDFEHQFEELSAAYGIQKADIVRQLGQNPEVITALSQQAMNEKVRSWLMVNNKVVMSAPAKMPAVKKAIEAKAKPAAKKPAAPKKAAAAKMKTETKKKGK